MAARFEVKRCMTLEDRGLFVLVGRILDGMVQVGMQASAETDGPESFRAPIHSVEFVEGEGGGVEPALTFHYRDPEKLRRWQALAWDGRVLKIEH